MISRDAKIIEMSEYCECECTVTCDVCKCYDGSNDEPEFASHDFYNKGWRIVNEILLCPKCFKNRNKKQ